MGSGLDLCLRNSGGPDFLPILERVRGFPSAMANPGAPSTRKSVTVSASTRSGCPLTHAQRDRGYTSAENRSTTEEKVRVCEPGTPNKGKTGDSLFNSFSEVVGEISKLSPVPPGTPLRG